MGLFREPADPAQAFLLPPSPRDWLPEEHLVWFVSETIDQLDLDDLFSKYRYSGKGEKAYSPRMMLKILVYAYATGLRSSRKIAAGLYADVPLRVLGGGQFPDFRTVNNFRLRHLVDLARIFVQVAQIAKENGLVKLGTVAIDGSKVKANASKHKAMSYDRMKKEEQRLEEEIRTILDAAARQDKLEDEQFGPNFRGDELPKELARREDRLVQIKAAKQRLEDRKAEEAREEDERKDAEAARTGKKRRERPDLRKHPKGKPKPKDQENFTDPDSRIMKSGTNEYVQGFNAQIAVDAANGIIIGRDVSQNAADTHSLVPLIDSIKETLGRHPDEALADAGYRSESNLNDLAKRGIDAYVAMGREGKPEREAAQRKKAPATEAMREKLQTSEGRERYRKRKHIAEAPFGWIKSILGFRSFSLRGLDKVRGEWSLVCLATNLRRMAHLMPRTA